jgi:hypothetical protein
MKEYVIDTGKVPCTEAPIELINAICVGEGGIIRIEPGAYAPKVLWSLKSLLASIGIGYQWATIDKLINKGMHPEHAEHYVTTMINNLIGAEVPPMPSDAELADIIKRYNEEHDVEDRPGD